ncbi:MAG: hypothetical protein JWN21_2228 [Sphingomonas bacterium]|nr:hypothetical protein [Sphingomonas bacterium]
MELRHLIGLAVAAGLLAPLAIAALAPASRPVRIAVAIGAVAVLAAEVAVVPAADTATVLAVTLLGAMLASAGVVFRRGGPALAALTPGKWEDRRAEPAHPLVGGALIAAGAALVVLIMWATLAQASAAPRSGFFLERDRDIGIGGQPHRVALHRRDQPGRDEVVVALVAPLSGVLLGQLDAVPLDAVDGADMDAVGADHFHMLGDGADVGHARSPVMMSVQRLASGIVA